MLRWDDADPQQWQVEYQVDNGRVDEALLGSLGKPLVFIEAKKQGNLSVKAEDFLRKYAAEPTGPRPSEPKLPKPNSGSGNLRGFRIRGTIRPAQNGWETLTSLASVLEQLKPGFLSELAAHGSPKRKWPRAARHDDPRLQAESGKPNYRPVDGHTEWLLLVHGSTAAKLGWMRQMTEIAGLGWGNDVEAILDSSDA
ncbi:hypothetical protein [Candidatus Poriferisodalis sp.]|uniref:hypothetical protein n=1 Tax=Candidatus Poriferisodalis sp. TaxID=3101277 RepID=UPI003C6F8137